MIVCIPNILTPVELDNIKYPLYQAEFLINQTVKPAKPNQKNKTSPSISSVAELTIEQITDLPRLKQKIIAAFYRNNLFKSTIHPKNINNLQFNRDFFGNISNHHPLSANKNQFSSWKEDIGFTLFLNSPTTYRGGELIISAREKKSYKLEAGWAVFYPLVNFARVNPVTQGIRLSVTGTIQSAVNDPHLREILFNLETAKRVIYSKNGQSPELDLINKSITSLVQFSHTV